MNVREYGHMYCKISCDRTVTPPRTQWTEVQLSLT